MDVRVYRVVKSPVCVKKDVSTPKVGGFERRICAQTQDLQIFQKFNMSQMNPKEVFHNTAYTVQLPYSRSLPLNASLNCNREVV